MGVRATEGGTVLVGHPFYFAKMAVCGRDPVYAPDNDFLGTINNPITILVYV